MVQTAGDWSFEVDRGPDWLFVRPDNPEHCGAELHHFAERLWGVLQTHFTYRAVLDLDRVGLLSSMLVGQLVMLQKRMHQRGGTLRLCGVNDLNKLVLDTCQLQGHLPYYESRMDAVHGNPRKPR